MCIRVRDGIEGLNRLFNLEDFLSDLLSFEKYVSDMDLSLIHIYEMEQEAAGVPESDMSDAMITMAFAMGAWVPE